MTVISFAKKTGVTRATVYAHIRRGAISPAPEIVDGHIDLAPDTVLLPMSRRGRRVAGQEPATAMS